MEIKKNGFYLIKKEFFEKIDDPYIPIKEKRPVFFCIQDKKNSEQFSGTPGGREPAMTTQSACCACSTKGRFKGVRMACRIQ